jgi:hypothetical protein
MTLKTSLTLLIAVPLMFACDYDFDHADPQLSVNEAALTAEDQDRELGEESMDWVKPGDKCKNGGQPDAQKCSERNDCPNVKTDDGITYKGKCGTVKKSNGKYTCACTQGKKIKKKKKKKQLTAFEQSENENESDEALSSDDDQDSDVLSDFGLAAPSKKGLKCRNYGQPDAQKCSARNDCPDKKGHVGICTTLKKSNGEYTCGCALGKKIKKKKKGAISKFDQ